MNNKLYAPIVIFAYNRPKELYNLLTSLEKNKELFNSKIIFFIDKYFSDKEKDDNNKVISLITDWSIGKNVEVNLNDVNLGLKKNILNGINTTFKNNENAIFLEDDLEVSEYFLDFMNNSLELYKNKNNVKHISGFNYPTFLKNSDSSYFTPYMNCWGWATWRNRWEENQNFSKNLISNKGKITRLKFTVLGFEKDFESQLIRNESKEISTWAIFWFQHIFLRKGLCLNPVNTLVINNGEYGEHGTNKLIYGSRLSSSQIINYPSKYKFKYINLIKVVSFFRNKSKIKKIT